MYGCDDEPNYMVQLEMHEKNKLIVLIPPTTSLTS